MSTIPVGGSTPYAPTKAITEVIERYRNPGLPHPLTVESLGRVGVSASLGPRVLQTFKIFGLITDDGKFTSEFETLRTAPTPDFKPKLVELLRSIYAEVFSVVEPAGATWEEVRDAFRGFTPHGQINRMVSLFLGLLEYAEYGESLPSARSASVRPAAGARTTVRNAPTRGTDKRPPSPPPSVSPPAHEPEGHRTSVPLGNAGTVALVVHVNPLLLSKEDRAFLFDLIDKIEERRAHEPAASQWALDLGLGGEAGSRREEGSSPPPVVRT